MKKLALIVLMLSCYLIADSDQVVIKGEYLSYKHDQIRASGNVIVLYRAHTVRANQITLDTATNKLLGQGDVVVGVGDSKKVYGQGLIFDLQREDFEIFESSALLGFQQSREDIFLQSRQMKISAEDNILQRASFTTCDLEHPHYWLGARKVIYLPDREVILYHMTVNFWFFPIPLYAPYYKFQLGERRVMMKIPSFGSNTAEGRYIKTETVYFWDEQTEGGILIDGLSKKGNGRGYWSKYQLSGLDGYIYGYGVEDRFANYQNNYVYKFRQELFKSDNSLLKMDYRRRNSYILPSGRENSSRGSLFFNRKDGQNSTLLNYSVNENLNTRSRSDFLNGSFNTTSSNGSINWNKNYYQSSGYHSEKLAAKYNQKLDQNWSININPDYYKSNNSSDIYDEKFNFDSSLSYRGDEFIESMKVYYNFYYDPDAETVTQDENQEYLERLPEVTARFRSLPLELDEYYLLSWQSSLLMSEIREKKYFSSYDQQRIFQTQKYQIANQLYRDFDLSAIFSKWHLSRSYDQRLYGSGDMNYLITDSSYLSTDLLSFIRHKYTYRYSKGEGGSPFYFDDPQKSYQQKLWDELEFYYQSNFSLKFTTAKDFSTGYFDDHLAYLMLAPRPGSIYFNFSSGWNRYSEQYRDLVGKAVVRPSEKLNISLSFIKDINIGELKNGYSQVDLKLGKPYEQMDHWNFWKSEWVFSIKNSYDFQTEYYNLVSFIMAKDLHCWDMKYYYTPVRKEWFIQFSLKAFPNEPIKFEGAEDDEFSVDAFRSLIDTDVNRF